jgi:hydrogenase maturation protease
VSAAARVVVVGVGNPWRRDDGAGPAVAAAVRTRLDDGVVVLELDGEAARLVDAWHGADLAVVVDAACTGTIPGTVHIFVADIAAEGGGSALRRASRKTRVAGAAFDLAVPSGAAGAVRTAPATSSHGLGVGQAIDLGGALHRLPGRLVVVGIEGTDFGPGPGLSPEVAAAVEPAARLVARLVARMVERVA